MYTIKENQNICYNNKGNNNESKSNIKYKPVNARFDIIYRDDNKNNQENERD